MTRRKMLRGGRSAVAVSLAIAGVSFAAAVASAAKVDAAYVWGQRVAGAVPVAAPGPAPAAEPPPAAVPGSPDEWFRPSGRNAGTEGVVRFLAELALRDNRPLYLSDGWGRTTGSGLSDHHVSRTDSWAADLAVAGVDTPTPATREAARRIATALGEPGWAGGTLVKTVSGYRIQVLWLVAGHFDHVHVGVRRNAQ